MPFSDELLGLELAERLKGQSFYEEKARALADSGLLKTLQAQGFQDSHVEAIMYGHDWKPKLDWIVENYEKVLKPMEFNGSHVSQIVVGADWKPKLDWMQNNYRTILQPLGISQSSAAKIVKGAEWEEKLKWVQVHYANSGLKQSYVVKAMAKKDWRNQLPYAPC